MISRALWRDHAEQALSDYGDRLAETERHVEELRARQKQLSEKMEDQENRGQRNNLKIIGLPESVKEGELVTFVETWLPADDAKLDISLSKVHSFVCLFGLGTYNQSCYTDYFMHSGLHLLFSIPKAKHSEQGRSQESAPFLNLSGSTMNCKLVFASAVLLLFLCCDVKGDGAENEEDSTYLGRLQNLAWSSWAQVSSSAQNLVEAAKATQFEKTIKEAYEKSTSAIGIYASILSDQVNHWWYGQ
ncbi:apolipoprotein C-II [Rhinatrema bivittatum]|uniref:apolipoprotein C-II n=1 Tax=Rhinatrema bivittatum TaxID=194408 RepID=UPI00112E1768|nr:apolipoprotein C-II [Rhinatrema bivittatum]